MREHCWHLMHTAKMQLRIEPSNGIWSCVPGPRAWKNASKDHTDEVMDSWLQLGNAVASDATLASSCPGGSIGGSRTKLFSDSGTERQNRHAGRPCAASAGCSFVELCAPAAPGSQALLQVATCTDTSLSPPAASLSPTLFRRLSLHTQTLRLQTQLKTAA